MSAMAYQITSLAIVYWTHYSGADQRKRQSSAGLAFVWEIDWWEVNSPHKGPVTRKMLLFDDVIMAPKNPLVCQIPPTSVNDNEGDHFTIKAPTHISPIY